jgi:hypothetical protein
LNALGYVNLSESFAARAQHPDYSYRFKGELGTLDYALVSESLQSFVVDMSHWHINADEVQQLDYNLEYKTELQQQTYYRADPYRSSDHDPVIVSLRFAKPNQAPVAVIGAYRFWLLTLLVSESYDPDGEIVSTRWQLPNGQISHRSRIWRWFWQLRNQPVELQVVDDQGAANQTVRRF